MEAKTIKKIEKTKDSSDRKRLKFTPLQESLLLLVGLKMQFEKALKPLDSEENIKNEDLKFTVCNHIQILLCSFLEEWKKLESLGQDEEIRTTLKIASPAIDRIRIWKGLPKIRNMLLAHSHRNKKGEVTWAWDVFAQYDAPTAYAETILLGHCALMAIMEAFARHQDKYEQAAQTLKKEDRTIKDKGIHSIGEIEAELKKIEAEM